MTSPEDQKIHNSIRLLKSEIKDLEARLQGQSRQILRIPGQADHDSGVIPITVPK
jgi:hypothetical protein